MKIRKFRGKNILEALNQVKKEFGENAIILSSEKIKTEGGAFFEITAAIEEPEINIYDVLEEPKEDLKGYLKRELTEIKDLLKRVLSPHLKHEKYIEYLEKGIPSSIAKDIVERNVNLPQYIMMKIKEKGSTPHSKYQVFIGEGGVGKTSNVFKLGVWYKYKYNANVLILSIDTYKVGGFFQVKRLSELLEIDFNLLDIEDLKDFLPKATSYDYVLIDTPGLSKKFGALELEILKDNLPFLRFQWVVKATEHFEHMLKLWDEIASFPIEGVFLTFTDKILTGLPVLWLLEDRFPPITFISTGERIPEDIARAEEEVLVNLFLKGIKE